VSNTRDALSGPYDAILILSFGGPEGPEDVIPFMENVTRGRGIPRERLEAVSGHYALFGGVSPINGLNRDLIASLTDELRSHQIDLPIYWGNRNWAPMLVDTLADMRADGITKALCFVTSAYSSASGCRQYREDIDAARLALGEDAPQIDKIRTFFNHPGFIEPLIDAAVHDVLSLNQELGSLKGVELACTAHSIPLSMAETSNYTAQLAEATKLVTQGVATRVGTQLPSTLVFQSRSGAPGQPWLEPDICDHLDSRAAAGATGIVMVPVGFISDHMEVVYDLDTQAAERAAELGLPVRRSPTPGTDPRFITMVRELIEERIAVATGRDPIRRALGDLGAGHDVCPLGCCPMPSRPTASGSPRP
jgi:protoporphyrin/coproporphyrin ferrochelatase